MKNKEYLISGCGYTVYFKTLKEMNGFQKFVDGIYNEMIMNPQYNDRNPQYNDRNLLYRCISISAANKMEFGI